MIRFLLLWLFVLVAAYALFEWLNSFPYQKEWGSEWSPRHRSRLAIYQQPRPLKQAPDIVIYTQTADNAPLQLLHHIRLDHTDDRADLRYHIDWMNDLTALFTLSCTNCPDMYTLHWLLHLDPNQPLAASIHPDSLLYPDNRWIFDKIND